MKNKYQQNFFDVIFAKKSTITTETDEKTGLSQIVFPRFKSKFMMKVLVPRNKKPMIHLHLDEHGTAVWNLIDGKKDVHEIAEILVEHFNHENNYEYRIAQFMTDLYNNGFIEEVKRETK